MPAAASDATRSSILLPFSSVMQSAANERWKPFMSTSNPGQTRSWPSSGEIACQHARRSAAFSPRWIRQQSSHCVPCFSKTGLSRPLEKEEQPGGLFDRRGNHYLVFDVDGTREAARQRALPKTEDRPAPQRRLRPLCAPGYTGRKRGEIVRTRTTILQAHTHQFLGTFGNAGKGDYRAELRRAVTARQSAPRDPSSL